MEVSVDRPNVLIIVSDDQGYGDLSCMGATDFRTPRLDALAASGVRFTSFYANSPVCSPSRASLPTGRYAGNAGVRWILIGYRNTPGLPRTVPTLATVLQATGGDPSAYELDGLDILPMLAEGAASPHAEVFWEFGVQTAVRRGRWKLVLNGQLVEGAPPEDDVFLADLDADPGERTNLKDRQPDLVADLRRLAEEWRAGLETRWGSEWQPRATGATTYTTGI
jgi:arylsulfatase A-like enzyme